MSKPIDSLTPLVLVSELRSRINADPNAADVNSRLLNLIVEQSQIFQEACGRRFDEYIETRYYTPFPFSSGGDLLGMRELALDADLKSYTSIVNGDASPIATGNVQLLPLNGLYKNIIRLNPYGIQFWYHAGVTDPIGSISVAGTWGYGGKWVTTGATLSGNLNSSDETFTSSSILENGMVLRIDSEYLYEADSTTNTVLRGFNGSSPAAHLAAAPIWRWKAQDAVQQQIIRLVQLALGQDKSPMFGQTIIGDVVFPVTVDSWPKDVVAVVRMSKLKRTQRITAV